jgi:hypothetical protein
MNACFGFIFSILAISPNWVYLGFIGAIIYRGVTCSRVSYNSHTADFSLDFSAFTFDDFCAMLNSDYLYNVQEELT